MASASAEATSWATRICSWGKYTRVDGDVDALYGANGYAIDSTTGVITFDHNQGVVLGYAHVLMAPSRHSLEYVRQRTDATRRMRHDRLFEWLQRQTI